MKQYRLGATFVLCMSVLALFSSCGPKNIDTPMNCGGDDPDCSPVDHGVQYVRAKCPDTGSEYGHLDPRFPACDSANIPYTLYCAPHFRPSDNTYFFSEDTWFTSSGDEGEDVKAQGGGCISRPLRDVWGVQVTDPAMTLLGPDDGDSHVSLLPTSPSNLMEVLRFDLHCHLNKPIVGDLDWDIVWKHEITAGTKTHPIEIRVNWAKVSGMHYIKKQAGTIYLRELIPGWVSFSSSTDIHADRTKASDAESGLREALK